MKKRGRLIIIEGGEGCGKTTQAKSLVDYLNNQDQQAIYCREPGVVREAEEIRNFLLNKENNLHPLTELYLFQGARAEFYQKVVIPKITEGINIVSDRSGISTIAYQGFAGNQDINLIKRLNKESTFGFEPDMTIIIDIDPEEGLAKETDPDRFASKGLKYHEQVRLGYLHATQFPNTHLIEYIKDDPEAMQQEIRGLVKTLFQNS